MAIQQNPNWPVLFVKGIGAMAVSDGTNVLGINADGSINISGTIVTTPTSPQVIAGNVGLVTGSHIIVDSMPPISVTATTSSPTIVSGNVGLVPGSVLDIIDRAARQLGHVVVDSQPALSLSSPTVVAGDVTIHGTADIIDRAMRQLGLVAFTVPQHVVVDSQPAFSLSSPTVIVGDVTTHGTTDVQDRVARQLGHVIVDSQPALSLSSPTVIAGDVTIHGTADVQDRIARQLGHVLLDTSPVVVIGRVGADIGSTGGLALDSTLTGGQQKTLVTNFPATQPVSGTISLSSPAVIAGDVTTHGTVDVQDRVARQLGIVSLSTSPIIVLGTVTTNIGDPGLLARDATLTGGQQKTLITNFPATQPVSGTISLSSPAVVAGDVTVHGTVDVQDRAARQLGIATAQQLTGLNLHINIDNSPAVSQLASSSPWVVGGTVTTQGTTDVQDRITRQLGHVLLDSSPVIIGGDVTVHGLVDMQDRVARQMGHVIVDSQPPFSLSSPTVIAGDATVHGIIDVQDRGARQLGHVLIDNPAANPVQVSFVPSSTQAVTQSTSPWVVAGDVTIHGTTDVQDRVARQLGHVIVDSQPAFTLASPSIMGGDVTVHGTIDMQDRVARQLGHVLVDSSSANPVSVTFAPSSTQAVTQSTSPWVIAGDANIHGTVDVQDRVARQLGHVLLDSSPVIIGGDVTVHGTTDIQDRTARQLGHVLIDNPTANPVQVSFVPSSTQAVTQSTSPWVVAGDVTTHGTVDVQDRVIRQIGLVGQALTSSPWVVGDVNVHGTIDVQDRGARQLGHVLVDNTTVNPVQVAFVPSSTQAVTQSTSPWVIAGDTTVHGTVDVQDRAARQLGNLTSPIVIGTLPSINIGDPGLLARDATLTGGQAKVNIVGQPVSVTFAASATQAVTQSTSPWVMAGDATVHGTIDVQDRVARQLGHVIVDSQPALSLSSPTVVAGDVTVHGTVDVQDRAARQLGIVTSRQDVLSSPWVIAGNIVGSVSHAATDISSASWTSATAVGTALSINIATAPSVALAITLNGAITAGSIAFEASMDNVSQSWFPVPLARVRDLIIEQTYALTNGNNSWQEGLSGFVRFRVRLIAAITGSGILYIALAGSAQASAPSATVGQAVGTNLHTWIDNSPAINQAQSPFVVGGMVGLVPGTVVTPVQVPSAIYNSSPWVIAATLQYPVGTIVPVQQVPVATSGLPLPFSQQVTTKVQVAGPCTVYGWHLLNTTAAIAYVQVFNKLVANVTLGTTVPDYVIPLPANSTTGAGATIEILLGIAHSTGMTVACTTTRTGSTTAAVDCLFFVR